MPTVAMWAVALHAALMPMLRIPPSHPRCAPTSMLDGDDEKDAELEAWSQITSKLDKVARETN